MLPLSLRFNLIMVKMDCTTVGLDHPTAATPFGIFLLDALLLLPDEYMDSARIDGARNGRYSPHHLPAGKPIMSCLAISLHFEME